MTPQRPSSYMVKNPFQNQIKLTSKSSKLTSATEVNLDEGVKPAFAIWSLKNRSFRAISPHRFNCMVMCFYNLLEQIQGRIVIDP